MATIEANAAIVINLITYFSNVMLAVLLLYLGKTTDFQKKIRPSWILLSMGIIVSATSYIFQIFDVIGILRPGVGFISSHIIMLVGTALAFSSFTSLYISRINEINFLRKRHKEIKKIMDRLKKKYLGRELPEKELRKLSTDLIKELVEIEVKLKELEEKGTVG